MVFFSLIHKYKFNSQKRTQFCVSNAQDWFHYTNMILFSKIMRFCAVQTRLKITLDKKFRTACLKKIFQWKHTGARKKHAVLNFLSSVFCMGVCTVQKRMILLNNIENLWNSRLAVCTMCIFKFSSGRGTLLTQKLKNMYDICIYTYF